MGFTSHGGEVGPVAFDHGHGSETDDVLLSDDDERPSQVLPSAGNVIALFRSAAIRSGRTTLPRRSRQFCATEHHKPASGRSESRERTVTSNSLPTSSGSRYCVSGISGSISGMSRKSGSDLRPFLHACLHTEQVASGRTATAGNGTTMRRVYISHFAGMPSHGYVGSAHRTALMASRIATCETPALAVLLMLFSFFAYQSCLQVVCYHCC